MWFYYLVSSVKLGGPKIPWIREGMSVKKRCNPFSNLVAFYADLKERAIPFPVLIL